MLLGLSLLLLGLVLSEATNKHKEKHHPKHSTHKRSSEIDQATFEEDIGSLAPLTSGKSYCFQYNGQIASGYAPWISTQQAMSRIECKVCISMQSHSQAILRMEKVRIGQRNDQPTSQDDQPWNAAQILSMKAFQQVDRKTATEMKNKLELPVEFAYIDGTVERLQFDGEDQPWSKNIKKAVLNLIQLNLKEADREQQDNEDEQNDYPVGQGSGRGQFSKVFTTTENTIEGVCQTTYTILSIAGKNEVNVTKTINFNRCEKLADIGYGFQVEPIAAAQLPQQQDASSSFSTSEQKKTGVVIPKEKLDRSTTIRYVLAKKEESNGYAIQRVELLSEYILKSSESESSQAMQTVASAQLVYVDTKNSNNDRPTNIVRDPAQNREESLLYNVDAESQEKQFYMFGDDKFTSSPFPFQHKDPKEVLARAETHLQKMVSAFEEGSQKNGGIESVSTVEHFQKLVGIIRRCSVKELKQLEEKAANVGSSKRQGQSQVALDLYMDALAVAATRNSIVVLAEKIQHQQNSQMSEIKAAQLLKILGRGAGLPAISDAQVDVILRLCKSSGVEESKMLLKQSCWLTFGTMVGELNQQTRKAKLMHITISPMRADETAEKHKMKLYKEVLIEKLNSASDIYEKVLALKCIGNAGLASTVPELKQLLNDQRQSPIVRINAIDALRRLRQQLSPESIQSIVLPIYTNTNAQPEVRIAAFSMIMQTRPAQPVIDQIAFTMAKEKCQDVQGFVYSAMKAAAQSPLPEERKIADHLRNALKLAHIDEEQLEAKHMLTSSQRWTKAFYSQQEQEGAFLSVVSMFTPGVDSALPTHISLGLDTFFNGQFNRNALKLTLCQKDIEQLTKQIFDTSDDQQEGESQGKKSGFFSNAAQQLRSIFGKLKIKSRDQKQQQQQGRNYYQHNSQSPFLALSVRLNDVDVMMLPMNMGSDQSSIGRMKRMVSNTLRHFFSGSQTERVQLNTAMVLNSRAAIVPTSVGLSLRLSQSMYIVGQVKTHFQGGNGEQVKAKLHPNFNWIQTQKMEVRAMVYSSGVRSIRSVALNLPLEAQFDNSQRSSQKQTKMSVKVPEQMTRLLAVHSLPVTFTKKINEYTKNSTDSHAHYHRVKTVHNDQLEEQMREVSITVGEKGMLALPIKVHGHFQQPRETFSLKELLKVIMSGDNHVSVDLNPNSNTPRQIDVTLNADVFQPTPNSPASSIRPRLHDFYAKDNGMNQPQEEFSSEEDDDRHIQRSSRRPSNSEKEKQQKHFTSYLEKFASTQKRNYKHSLKIVLEAVGSRKNRAEVQLESVCDARLRACEATVQARQSCQGEPKDWTLEAQVQTLYPDYVSDVNELQTESTSSNKQQQSFFCHAEAKWGAENSQQSIKLNIQGQPSARMLRDIARQQQQYSDRNNGYNSNDDDQFRRCSNGRQCSGKSQRVAKNIPFLDQYQLVADYSLRPSTKHYFMRQIEALKANNFWSTKSKLLSQTRGTQNGGMSQGQAECTITIDPVTSKYANVSIQTESQSIQIRPVELPMRMRPMPLVRQFRPSSSSHSTGQLLTGLMAQGRQDRAQCKVGMKTVDTFDGVAYKAPISKCYTVLAKDCANGEQPKFAVLMKSLQTGSEEKKIKIITPDDVIVIEPQGENQLRIKVNDKSYTIGNGQERQEEENALRQKGIEFETDYQDRQTVTVDVDAVAVKFNGKTAKIQLSEKYKHTQCGLCGNYNDDSDDELRTGNDELVDDVKTFHRSYALQEDDECREDEQKNFYEKQQQDAFSHNSRNQQQQRQIEPVERTMTMEYNHKVCFSLKAVKQCPQGYYPGEEDEEGKELLKRNKVNFACLDRQSIEAKRLRSIVRRTGTADVSEYSASFVETVVVPDVCVKY